MTALPGANEVGYVLAGHPHGHDVGLGRDHGADAGRGPVDGVAVAIVTLGCGRNEVDTDELAGMLARDGAVLVEDARDADAVLVNTCTFIAPAKQESIDTILAACQLKEEARARAVLVVGCMAQRYPHELADAIPEADVVVGFDGYASLPAIVGDALAGRVTQRVVGVGAAHPGSRPTVDARRQLPLLVASDAAPAATVEAPAPVRIVEDAGLLGLSVRERDGVPATAARVDGAARGTRVPASGPLLPVRRFDGGPWAYLKIASGCDRVCTFCAIPSFRGRFRSRPLGEILTEAAWLVAGGARELVLVSENTTSWGKDLPGGRSDQPTLLRELAAIDGLARIRLLYLQPAELTSPLLDAIAAEPKVAGYYDLSLQHVSAPVVARMGRSGDHVRFGRLLERIRAADPTAVVRSSFILGFPGETEHDVDTLEEFLAEHELDWVGLFPFSREDGTPSAALPDQVPEQVVRARLERIRETQERAADAAARRFVGRHLDVLVEQVADAALEGGWPDVDRDEAAGATLGRSYREAPDTDGEVALVTADGAPADLPVGRVVRARVVDALGVDLVAEVGTADGDGRHG